MRVSIILACIVGFVALLLGGIRFYRAYADRQWYKDTEFRVLDTELLVIKVYTPGEKVLKQYVLPPDGYVEVPNGYGFFKIKDIPELSRVEKKGDELILGSISDSFGIPFDATPQTLTEWDRLLLWYADRRYGTSVETIQLAQAPIFTEETRIDGVTIDKVDPTKVDRYFKHDLFEKAIAVEGLTIGVFNTSGEANVARTIARKLEKIGGRVIEITNLQEESGGTCEIRANEHAKESFMVKRMTRLFPCNLSGTPPHERFDIMFVTRELF
jgi:hypothetical protein